MPGPGDVDRAQVARLDHAVHVHVDEVEPRCRAPVPEQPGLHVLDAERLAEERVVEQVDLTDREVVRGAPVGVTKVRRSAFGAESAWSRCRSRGTDARPACRAFASVSTKGGDDDRCDFRLREVARGGARRADRLRRAPGCSAPGCSSRRRAALARPGAAGRRRLREHVDGELRPHGRTLRPTRSESRPRAWASCRALRRPPFFLVAGATWASSSASMLPERRAPSWRPDEPGPRAGPFRPTRPRHSPDATGRTAFQAASRLGETVRQTRLVAAQSGSLDNRADERRYPRRRRSPPAS